MIRVHVQLDEDQYERLKALAEQQSQSISHLVREGIDRLLAALNRDEAWARLLRSAGSCTDPEGTTDVSSRHDAYLADAYEK